MSAEATSAAKRALRERVRGRRRARVAEHTDADRHADAVRLADAVLTEVRAYLGHGVCRVAAYESRPTEPPTDVLLERLRESGFDVLVPVTMPDRDLDWRSAVDRGSARLGRNAVSDAAVIVVPALAVDRHGRRLGQGGGSYDRALPRRAPHALVVALVHDDEVLAPGTVPVGAHDVAVDAVVTASAGWTWLSPAG